MPIGRWLERVGLLAARRHAQWTLARFFAAARDAETTQHRVLFEKLRRHAESDYGREHGFARIRSYGDFAARVPVRCYEDFAPYIERMKRGEARVLLGPGGRVLMFALTSGTTREPKYIPVTPEFLAEYRRGWNAWGLRALLDHPGCFLRSIVQVSSPMNEHYTEAGIPCGAITGLMAATQKRLVRRYYTTPLAISEIHDSTARYYAIMRLSIPQDASFLITANPATLLLLARTADGHREAIVRDIRDGTLSAAFDVPQRVRAALRGRLRPDPACASRLERIIAVHGALRPRDYWRLGFIAHWTGGTMGLYRERFPEWFGDVPVRDPGLLASEGRMSVVVEDHTPAGILEVTSHFYEFIPAEEYESPDRAVLPMRAVETGREYFLVLTTSSGLVRYDLGDRVRIAGRFSEAPIIEFLSKGAHTSSMTGEKLTEHQVVAAMESIRWTPRFAVDGFVLAPRWDDPPFYRLYVEAVRDGASDAQAAVLARAYDENLSTVNVEYASKRQTRRLGPVRVILLPPGRLAEYDDERRSRQGGRAEQFKHRFLMSGVEREGMLFGEPLSGAISPGQSD